MIENPIATAAFKKIISELFEHVKTAFGNTRITLMNEKSIDNMYKHIANVGLVRTLWQIDKRVYVKLFFNQPHINVTVRKPNSYITETKRIRFTSIGEIQDLSRSNKLVIKGIAGQGKSILLRYICINELQSGKVIPVFVELRRISMKLSLKKCIYNEIRNIGLHADDDIFKKYSESGRFLLLLDGYDEISAWLVGDANYQLDQLAIEYPKLSMVITTRPDSSGGIEMSNAFETIAIDNLKDDEYSEYINKMVDKDEKGADYINLLINKIKSNQQIRELLQTPLMVTILVVTYKAHQYIPYSIPEFYDELFPILYQRHDGTKPGFERERRCNTDHFKAQRILSALCCISKDSLDGSSSLLEDDLYRCTEKALSFYNLSETINPKDFYSDIIKLTGLIINEGNEFRFIHKSIQEYYCAKFINGLPDNKLEAYVKNQMLKDFAKFHKELEFLLYLNKPRTLKQIFLPVTDSVLKNVFEYINFINEAVGISDIDYERQSKDILLKLGTKVKLNIVTPLNSLIKTLSLISFDKVFISPINIEVFTANFLNRLELYQTEIDEFSRNFTRLEFAHKKMDIKNIKIILDGVVTVCQHVQIWLDEFLKEVDDPKSLEYLFK